MQGGADGAPRAEEEGAWPGDGDGLSRHFRHLQDFMLDALQRELANFQTRARADLRDELDQRLPERPMQLSASGTTETVRAASTGGASNSRCAAGAPSLQLPDKIERGDSEPPQTGLLADDPKQVEIWAQRGCKDPVAVYEYDKLLAERTRRSTRRSTVAFLFKQYSRRYSKRTGVHRSPSSGDGSNGCASIDTSIAAGGSLPMDRDSVSENVRVEGGSRSFALGGYGLSTINSEVPGWTASDGATTVSEERTFREDLLDFVRSSSFDYVSGTCVLLNAFVMGIQTDWQARHVSGSTPWPFRVLDVVFCVIFLSELVLRLLAHGPSFFARGNRVWHSFDCFLVGSQLLEIALELVAPDFDEQRMSSGAPNLSVLRTMRILRLIRVTRLVRVLRLIGELRTLLMSIFGSLKSMSWAVILLFLLMYVMGVYLTQVILDYRLDLGNPAPDVQSAATQELIRYYGSLGDTILSVFMAVTGGVDWESVLVPLKTQISALLVPCFMAYIAFVIICMLNVITGVFVESALLTAKRDKATCVVNGVQSVFDTYDSNRSGELSLDEFQSALGSEEMKLILGALDIDISEADGLFHLLDAEGTGHISAGAFAHGCARLRGPAKAVELAILMRKTNRLVNSFNQFSNKVDQRLNAIMAAGRKSDVPEPPMPPPTLRSAGHGGRSAAPTPLKVPGQVPTILDLDG